MKKKFRSLEIVAKKYLQTYSAGIHATLLKDSLVEVDVVREYQPGDKRLDSKSSLKMGRIMSRVFNPDRALNIFIVLDLSSSSFDVLEQSITIALYFVYLAEICNERVGLCIFSDRVSSLVQPSEDYSSVVGCLEKAYDSFTLRSGTSIDVAMNVVANLSMNNALAVLVSDFYYTISDKLLNTIKRLASVDTNKFLAVILSDRRDWLDVGLPFSVSFLDAESGKVVDFNLHDRLNYDKWAAELKKVLWRSGADTVFLNAEEERYLMPLVKYLMRT